MLAKGTFYIVGGLMIAKPVISGAQKVLMEGWPVMDAVDHVIYQATSYSPETGEFNQARTPSVVMRNVLGVGAIYVASRL